MALRGESERVAMKTTTPSDAYAAARQRLDRQMTRLQAHLDRHASLAAANPKDWGPPSDLGHVAEILEDAIEFLGGTREETA